MNFIFEGTNGIGKDFLIDHLKNITKSVNVYRLPRYWFEHFCTLETYENLNILSYDILYSNMISNSRPNVMSIQYRSPLTGVIGNKFRWLEYPKVDYDVDPFIDFIMNRYTKNEMFVIFVFKYSLVSLNSSNVIISFTFNCFLFSSFNRSSNLFVPFLI